MYEGPSEMVSTKTPTAPTPHTHKYILLKPPQPTGDIMMLDPECFWMLWVVGVLVIQYIAITKTPTTFI